MLRVPRHVRQKAFTTVERLGEQVIQEQLDADFKEGEEAGASHGIVEGSGAEQGAGTGSGAGADADADADEDDDGAVTALAKRKNGILDEMVELGDDDVESASERKA